MSNKKVNDSGAIRVETVSKTFGTGTEVVCALDDVTLDVRENEFFTYSARQAAEKQPC